MKLLFVLILCGSTLAQYRQLAGSSGSVAGQSNSATASSTALVGQPVVGEASGGAFGTRGGITSIFEETIIALDVPFEEPPLPAEYSFAQNYPNPFNPSTTFEFALPKSAVVTLTIFDELGRTAAQVFQREFAAGHYITHFQAPASWASGLYFAVFNAGDFRQVRKLVLLK